MNYIILYNVVDGKVGVKSSEIDESFKFQFRLKDDDGNIYFYGRSKTNDDEKAFEPLDDTMDSWGCTSIEYMNNYLEWEQL